MISSIPNNNNLCRFIWFQLFLAIIWLLVIIINNYMAETEKTETEI